MLQTFVLSIIPEPLEIERSEMAKMSYDVHAHCIPSDIMAALETDGTD